MQYRAGEGGTQTVAEERNLSPRPVWTASWSDRGIAQPVRQYTYENLTYTVYGKAEEAKRKQKYAPMGRMVPLNRGERHPRAYGGTPDSPV